MQPSLPMDSSVGNGLLDWLHKYSESEGVVSRNPDFSSSVKLELLEMGSPKNYKRPLNILKLYISRYLSVSSFNYGIVISIPDVPNLSQ